MEDEPKSNTNNRVDMEQMNATIYKVLSLPTATQSGLRKGGAQSEKFSTMEGELRLGLGIHSNGREVSEREFRLNDRQQGREIRSAYRRMLIDSEHASTESFDKTVLYLSGGALGLSMAFLQNILGPAEAVQVVYLVAAWVSWALSLIFTLSSFWLSAAAMRRAIKQLDEQTIGQENAGGWWNKATKATTFLGGFAFIVGVFAMIIFVESNL